MTNKQRLEIEKFAIDNKILGEFISKLGDKFILTEWGKGKWIHREIKLMNIYENTN